MLRLGRIERVLLRFRSIFQHVLNKEGIDRQYSGEYIRTHIKARGEISVAMAQVRLKFKPPAGEAVQLSAEHPDDVFKILASRPTEDGFLSLVEIETADPAAIIQYFEEASEVHSYEVLESDAGNLLIQHVRTQPEPHRIGQETGTIAKFPLTFRNGWMFMDLVITHERLSEFTDGLAAAGIPFEVLSVTQSVDVMNLLTDRQREVITEAVERGYYDSPRECSLVDLADTLNMSQSTASGILHRAEEHIIKEVIGESAV